jgi:hypothetical protein
LGPWAFAGVGLTTPSRPLKKVLDRHDIVIAVS